MPSRVTQNLPPSSDSRGACSSTHEVVQTACDPARSKFGSHRSYDAPVASMANNGFTYAQYQGVGLPVNMAPNGQAPCLAPEHTRGPHSGIRNHLHRNLAPQSQPQGRHVTSNPLSCNDGRSNSLSNRFSGNVVPNAHSQTRESCNKVHLGYDSGVNLGVEALRSLAQSAVIQQFAHAPISQPNRALSGNHQSSYQINQGQSQRQTAPVPYSSPPAPKRSQIFQEIYDPEQDLHRGNQVSGQNTVHPNTTAARMAATTNGEKPVQRATPTQPPEPQPGQETNGTVVNPPSSGNPTSAADLMNNDENEEAAMKELFLKMRAFNRKNPQLLAKIWHEERESYVQSEKAALAASAKAETKTPTTSTKLTTIPTPNKTITAATSTQPTRQDSQQSKAITPAQIRNEPARKIQVPQVDAPRPQDPKFNALLSQATEANIAPIQASQVNTSPNQATQMKVSPVPKRPDAEVQEILHPTPKGMEASSQVVNDMTALPQAPTSESPPHSKEILNQPVTVWPADKKVALAVACADLVLEDPYNRGRGITPSEVLSILKIDPTYRELCNGLESRGLKIDQARLARLLLQKVPAVTPTARRPLGERAQAGQPRKFQVSKEEQLVNAEKHLLNDQPLFSSVSINPPIFALSTSSSQVGTSNNRPPMPIGPSLEGLDALKDFVARPRQSERCLVSARQDRAWTSLPPPTSTLTKEAQSRKRTFGELVDLTNDQEPDGEGLFPNAKRQEVLSTHQDNISPPTNGSAPASMKGPRPIHVEPSESCNGQQRPKPQTLTPDHRVLEVNMTQPLSRYKAIRRSKYEPKTIARDVLLASGRHPEMRHLNAHLELLKQFPSVNNESDLATFRWDLVDPDGPPPGSGNRLGDITTVAIHEDESDEVQTPGALRQLVGTDGRAIAETFTSDRSTPAGGKHILKSGPSNKPPQYRRMAEQGSNKAVPTPRTSIQPAAESSSAAVGRPIGYAELRANQETPGESKKKGRPVGWRKWMAKGPGASQKARPDPSPPEPIYQVYKCEWEDCSAELHNLATLRRHIHKKHGIASAIGCYVCRWGTCLSPVAKVRRVYQNDSHWKQHIEDMHLSPIARRLGDGPTDGLSDHQDSELSETYLSDSRGRRVTPRIVAPDDLMEERRPGETQAERSAREELEVARRRRHQVGYGLDRAGSRLANDKRRQGFIDDDDSARIIEADEDD